MDTLLKDIFKGMPQWVDLLLTRFKNGASEGELQDTTRTDLGLNFNSKYRFKVMASSTNGNPSQCSFDLLLGDNYHDIKVIKRWF